MDNALMNNIKGLVATGRLQRWLVTGLLVGVLAVGCAKKPEELIAEAQKAMQSRDFITAETKLEKLIEQQPANKNLLLNGRIMLARCYAEDQDFERARKQVDEFIQAVGGPATKEGFQALGLKMDFYIADKKPEKALDEALKTSDTLGAKMPAAAQQALQLRIAQIYMANKKPDKALAVAQSVITRWSDDKNSMLHLDALNLMGQIYAKQKDSKKALEIHQAYLNTHPNSPVKWRVLFSIGSLERRMGMNPEAKASLDACEEALRQQYAKALGADEKGSLLLQLAQVQQARSNFDGARQTLKKVATDFPTSPMHIEAKLSLAQVLMLEQKPGEAIATLQEVVKENPNSQAAAMAQNGIKQITAIKAQLKKTSGTLTTQTTGTLQTQGAVRPTSGTAALAPAGPPKGQKP